MKQAAFAALLVVLVPLHAAALDQNEILGLVAMPLAVAAVSEVTNVPAGDLAHFVATLNRAEVPPTQIVQVVRYAPVALVVPDQQPTFVQYVDTEVDRGIVGSQLVTVIEDRYRTYDLEPEFVTLQEPATTYVVRDDYIPQTVVTRVTEVQPVYAVNDSNDLLALVAMPLAVAAVSQLTDVPMNELSSLVASLNAARVPPLQMVEVLRYTPVVLVNDYERPRFLQFVSTEVNDGITGTRLVDAIGDRLRTYDVSPQFGVLRPSEITVVDDAAFFPPVVNTRVAEVRSHPHGGPPGQLKKELGLRTGAEVVHGTKPGAASRRVVSKARADRDVVERPKRATVRHKPAKERKVVRENRAPKVEKQRIERMQQPRVEKRQRAVTAKPQHGQRGGGGGGGRAHGHQGGGGHGKGKGKGKG